MFYNLNMEINKIILIMCFVLLFSCKEKKLIKKEEPVYDKRNISRMEGKSMTGGLAVDKFGNVHIVWGDSAPNGNWEIIYKMKSVFGEWSDTQNVSKTVTSSTTGRIAVDNYGNPHVVWEEYNGERIDIYYSCKEQEVWSTPVNISNYSNKWNELPDIGIDMQGRVHVIWMGGGIGYTRKEGNIWIPPKEITALGPMNPSMYVEPDGKIHIVYQHGIYSGEIMYLYSPDGGNTWEGPVNVSQSPSYYCYSPHVVADRNGKVYVVWIKSKFGVGIIGMFIAVKEPNGSWSTPQQINSVKGNPYAPSINVNENNEIYICYMDVVDIGGGILKDDIFM